MTERPDIIKTAAADAVFEQPEWLQERLQWFSSLKFGLFMHWGPYCQWGCIESWPLVEADTWARPDDLACWTERGRDLARFRKDYWALNRTFNPTQFNPERWAELAKYAGMKYVAFTTKHHDGFSMFDTRQTDYRVTHPDCPFSSSPRANIVREVFDAFRAQDFAVSCYFSKSDWHHSGYWDPARPAPDRNPNFDTLAEPERWETFVQFVHKQIEELMTDYGPLATLWLDGGQVRPPLQDIRMAEIAARARVHQPGLIVADRTVGGPYENLLTPEQEIPEEPLPSAWESCLTMGDSWAYKPNDRYKSTRRLIEMLLDIVAKGGNLLLNVGPDPDGLFPPEAVERLGQIGDWMAVNASAIHDTQPIAPYCEGQIRYTSNGDTVYAAWVANEGETAPPAQITIQGLCPSEGAPVRMLGVAAPLSWRFAEDGAQITLPDHLPCNHAWVLSYARR